MKKKDRAIKYSKWTTTFFYTFAVLFVLITIGGMIYSYTNLIQLSHEISYKDNSIKSNFWPVFTEITMVCLGVLILVVRLNKWPRLLLFRFLFYVFALFVLLANGYNTSIQHGFNLIAVVDLIIQEWPVICYLVFIEIALYVITNVINDRVTVEFKPPLIIDIEQPGVKSESDKQLKLKPRLNDSLESKFIEQPELNKEQKELNKQKLLNVFKSNPSISQNKACEQIGVSNASGTNYVRELRESNELDRRDGKWIVIEW